MKYARGVRWLGLVFLFLLPTLALAQGKKEKEEAGAHFTKGIDFYKEGNYAAALAEFNAAYKAVPSYEVLFNIGLSERRLFKYGESVKSLNKYLAEGGAKVPKDRREAVKKELDAIRELVAEVTITIDGAPAFVEIDGEKLGKSPFSEPFLIGPGKHTFRAERDGEEPDEKTMELVSVTKVEVALKPRIKETPPGELTIESSPASAIITLDGKIMGTTPVKATLKEGGHEVIAEIDGYVTARTEVVLSPGQSRKVTIELEPLAARGRGKLRFPLVGVIVIAVGGGLIGGGAGWSTSASSASRQVTQLFSTGGQWNDTYAGVEGSGKGATTGSLALMVVGGVVATAGVVISVITLLSGSGGGSDEEGGGEESHFFFAPTDRGATVGWSARW